MALLVRLSAVAVTILLAACTAAPPASSPTMNDIAERYVRLALAIGQHDENFVDAYYGNPAWKPTAAPVPLADLAARAEHLRGDLENIKPAPGDGDLERLRHTYLDKQLAAVQAKLAMLMGNRLSFDNEAARLYDADPPHLTEADFKPSLDELERLLPGTGTLPDRYADFRAHYVVPAARLDAVFRAAIDGCRARTLAHVTLPPGETFTIEYVTGKSWSAYNWYKGQYASVIQVNTDLPITIDRAIDLACHEGYPGHHVYNSLLEKHLVRDRGWVEFTIYPLFSPQSLIAEGTANFGIEVAFPGDERTAFERDTLYPLAGLPPASADRYTQVQRAVAKLGYAGNEAARRYLNSEIDRAAAADYLTRYAMMPKDRADQRTRFFDQYRSYVINYNLGQDLVRAYVEAHGGTVDHPDVRWRVFEELLSSPRLPSGLRQFTFQDR
ncbi:MAG TPA: hypothetical protein VFV78_06435 [Vicinamibacterales bacterium]|nr:hypothetical protein [Vicinamibacterales bacterium]